MKVLITGVSGFLGANMALDFKRLGYEVTGLDIKETVRTNELEGINFVVGDIRDSKLMTRLIKDVDVVCALAGQVSHLYSQDDPKKDLDVNVNGILTVLNAIRTRNPKCQLLYASSRSVYGFPKYLPIDEEHPTRPIDAYGISKLASEHYVRLYQYHYGLRTTIFRQANLFGPRQQIWTSDFQMISWVFRCIKLNEPFTFYGDGEQMRDFLYVDDCVKAYELAVQYPERCYGQIFNLGGKDYITWNKLFRICEEVTGNKAKVEYIEYSPLRLKLENPFSCLNYAKAKQLLGWTPKVPVQEGIEKMNRYFTKERIEEYTKWKT